MTKIDSGSPQACELRTAVEKIYGKPADSYLDYSRLSELIEEKTCRHISETTLRRVWNYSQSYLSISQYTLDTLSMYCGYSGWDGFAKFLKAKEGDSEIVRSGNTVISDSLAVGQRLRIGWRPDRICIVEYLGNRTFRAVETVNSKMKPGDIFTCASFSKGRALYVDDFHHADQVFPQYGMGIESGLTLVEILPSSSR